MTFNYAIVNTIDELRALLERMDAMPDKTFGFDIETGYHGPDKEKAALDPDYGFIVGFSFGQSEWARYVPIGHDMYANLDPEEVWPLMAKYIDVWGIHHADKYADDMQADERYGRLASVLDYVQADAGKTDKSITKAGWKLIIHKLSFERRYLRRVGIEVGCFSDTMIEGFAMGVFKSVSLKAMTKDAFGHDQQTIETLFPGLTQKQLKCLRFNVLDVTPQVIDYACEDSLWAHRHNAKHYAAVKDTIIYKTEMAIADIVCDMEDEGTVHRWDELRAMAKEAESFEGKLLAEIKADLSAQLGKPLPATFNINSSPQLAAVLFDGLGMTSVGRTAGGAPSTNAVALEALSKKHDVVKKILEFREVQALRKRYLEKWPAEYDNNRRDGRAHASVNQVAVGTGRFAVNDPALQQCPKPPKHAIGLTNEQRRIFHTADPRSDEWKDMWNALSDDQKLDINFRDTIVAPDGFYILDFDYSQVELRIMAGLSQEQTLLDAFNNDIDVHSVTASVMLGIPIDQLTKDQRAIGKTMNFALLYGMGVNSLGARLAVSKERARELYDSYFAGFASITEWMERMKRDGIKHGYTVSWAGRRYTIWELQSSNPKIYSKGERVCVNAPVQGGAADYMKIAMVRVRGVINANGWRDKVKLVMNNHDALTFYVHESLDPHTVRDALLPAVEYQVPNFPKIVSEWEMGYRWGSMTPIHSHTAKYEIAKDGGVYVVHKPEDAPEPEDDDFDIEEESLPEHGMTTSGPAGDDDFPMPTKSGVSHAPVAAGTPDAPTVTTQSQTKELIDEQRAAARAAEEVIPTGTVQRLVVEVSTMPTMEAYTAFLEFVRVHPGNDIITVITPEGEIDLDARTSLSPKDAPMISMTLKGANVHYATDSVDASAFSDLSL